MIRILELCSGYGTATFALKMENISHELVGYSDKDKYANQCFKQNHGGKELGDMTKIDIESLPDFDLLTCGFPCQDVSVAGKQDLSKGRTILGYELQKYLRIKKPKYFMFENVKGILSKKFKPFLDELLKQWSESGYNVHYKVLNTKEYGIPQNRERVFFVGIRTDLNQVFKFPEKEELKIFLKDILEDEVDEKYYLKEEKVRQLIKNDNWNCNPSGRGMNGNVHRGDVAPTVTTNKGEGHKIAIPVITPDRVNKRQNGRRFKTDGEPMFTLNTQDRHGILQINNPKHSNNRVYSNEGISPTLNTMQGGDRQPFVANKNLIIRKLTPKECFRLQGFLNDEINLEGLSNTQQYKLSGNGQSVNVVRKIFRNLLKNEY